MSTPPNKRTQRRRKSARLQERRKPISEKVYDDLTRRIRMGCISVSPFPWPINRALKMLDEYLEDRTIPSAFKDPQTAMIFELLRPEIDRAIARSSRARARAKLRREAKARMQEAEKPPTGNVAIPATTHTEEAETTQTPDKSQHTASPCRQTHPLISTPQQTLSKPKAPTPAAQNLIHNEPRNGPRETLPNKKRAPDVATLPYPELEQAVKKDENIF